MFNRESILKSLNTENYYIDKHSLDLFLDDWKIEAIYEDENGVEFFDDDAVEKIKNGITPNNNQKPEIEHQEIMPETQDDAQENKKRLCLST